jgi:hypothetical protein
MITNGRASNVRPASLESILDVIRETTGLHLTPQTVMPMARARWNGQSHHLSTSVTSLRRISATSTAFTLAEVTSPRSASTRTSRMQSRAVLLGSASVRIGPLDKMYTAWHKSRVCGGRAIRQILSNTNTRTGFTEGKPYKLTTSNGRQFTTDQYALVAHGTAERPWPFLACSDSKFTDAEFDRYVSALDKDNLRAPSRKFINSKLDDIHALLNHNWTDDDIQSKISKQRAMEKKYDPANAANLQREKINKRRSIAQEEDDAEEVAKCDAELAALENLKLNGGASRPQPRDSPAKPMKMAKEHDRLQKLNIETRRTNAEEVRKALVEERRKIQKAREKAIAEARAKAKAAEQAASGLGADLFGEASDVSRLGTPANGTPKISRTSTPANGNAGKKTGGPIGAIKGRSKMDDDVIGSMDLGIDIEI